MRHESVTLDARDRGRLPRRGESHHRTTRLVRAASVASAHPVGRRELHGSSMGSANLERRRRRLRRPFTLDRGSPRRRTKRRARPMSRTRAPHPPRHHAHRSCATTTELGHPTGSAAGKRRVARGSLRRPRVAGRRLLVAQCRSSGASHRRTRTRASLARPGARRRRVGITGRRKVRDAGALERSTTARRSC